VQAKSAASLTLSYWHRKLPTTPIPDALRELISPLSSKKTLDQVLDTMRSEGEKAASASVGKSAPKRPAYQPADRNPHYGVCVDDDDVIADPSLSAMFFLEKELHTGKKLTLYSGIFKRSTRTGSPPDRRIFFLPRSLAEAIPFSSDKLSVVLEKLNISQGSETALAMKQTLQVCESPANSGESKYCATSLESMVDYATSTLGSSRVDVLETNVAKVESLEYSITGIPFRGKSGSKSVSCHSQKYAYAVYYCHDQTDDHTTMTRVSLKAADGSGGEGVVLCHLDTSGWNPKHVAFKVLNVKPGGAPLCHFVADDHVFWVPAQ